MVLLGRKESAQNSHIGGNNWPHMYTNTNLCSESCDERLSGLVRSETGQTVIHGPNDIFNFLSLKIYLIDVILLCAWMCVMCACVRTINVCWRNKNSYTCVHMYMSTHFHRTCMCVCRQTSTLSTSKSCTRARARTHTHTYTHTYRQTHQHMRRHTRICT